MEDKMGKCQNDEADVRADLLDCQIELLATQEKVRALRDDAAQSGGWKERVKALEADNTRLRGNNHKLGRNCEKLRKLVETNENLKSLLMQLRSEFGPALAEKRWREELQAKVEHDEEQITTLADSLKRANTHVECLQSKNKKLQGRVNEKDAIIDAARKEFGGAGSKIMDLENSNKFMNARLDMLRQRAKSLVGDGTWTLNEYGAGAFVMHGESKVADFESHLDAEALLALIEELKR